MPGARFGDRACLAADTCRRHSHGAPDRARRAAAAPAGAAAKPGAGADRGAADRSGGQAGDGAGARRDDRDPLTRRDPRAGRGHRQEVYAAPTGRAGLNGRSRRRSPGAISRTVALSSPISPRAISRAAVRAGALRLHPRDGRRDKPRSSSGCCAPPTLPIAVEVFEGHTAIRPRSPSNWQDQGPLRVEAGGAGRRRGLITSAASRKVSSRRARLDHRAPGAGDPDARGRRRPAAAVAVRRAPY